jgi:hypothetical protein
MLRNSVQIGLTAALFCLGVSMPVLPQKIEPVVTLSLEILPLEKQQKLKDFAQTIESYIRDFDWTGQEFDEPLSVTLNIQLQDASTSYEDRYSGTFMISNNSDMQYYDKYWRFPYSPEKSLDHKGVYQPFTGFIDFYINVILGGEFDKLGLNAGTQFYEKARLIADQASFDAQFSTGWKERTEWLQELMGDENKLFREMKDRYYLGFSYAGENGDLMKKAMKESIDLMKKVLDEDSEHKDCLNFIKAHHLEIIEIFKDDQEVIGKMIKIDPDREDTYRKYLF